MKKFIPVISYFIPTKLQLQPKIISFVYLVIVLLIGWNGTAQTITVDIPCTGTSSSGNPISGRISDGNSRGYGYIRSAGTVGTCSGSCYAGWAGFDLGNNIPSGATITGAELIVYLESRTYTSSMANGNSLRVFATNPTSTTYASMTGTSHGAFGDIPIGWNTLTINATGVGVLNSNKTSNLVSVAIRRLGYNGSFYFHGANGVGNSSTDANKKPILRVTYTLPCTASTAPASISASPSTTICSGTSVNLTTNGGTNGTNAVHVWYTGGCTSGYINRWDAAPGSVGNTTVNSVTDGVLRVTATTNDPVIQMPNTGTFNTASYKYINIRYKTTSATGVEIYYSKNTANSDLSEDKKVTGTYINDGAWHTLSINMSSSVNWTGTVYGWRFDWATTNGAVVEFDFIEISTDPMIGEGATIAVSPTSTTTYYTKKIDNCGTTTTCASQTITVNPIPSAPSAATPQNFCGANTIANLTATGTAIKWYPSATGGVNLSTGTALSAGTYYASQTVSGCESSRTGITVTISPLEAGSVSVSSQASCSGTQLTGTTPSCGCGNYSYQWEMQTNCSGAWVDAPGASTGANYQPGALAQDACFRRRVTDECGNVSYSTPAAQTNNLLLNYTFDEIGQPTKNVVTNTDLNTGWSQGYQTNILFNEIAPPAGISSPTVGFIRNNASGYWYSYGDYAPQVQGATYTVSLYVKTLDPNFNIRFYTADNTEATDGVSRYNSEYIHVPNDGNWHRVVWNSFVNHPSSQSNSLSFNFTYSGAIGDPNTRTWFCAPQMEQGTAATPFVTGTRDPGTVTDYSGNGNNGTILLASSPQWIPDGHTGGAYSFDGTPTKYIRGNVSFPAQDWTISLWVMKKAHNPGTYPIFVSFSLPYIACNGNTSPFRLSYSAPGQVNTNGTTIPVLNQWYHVVATSDASGTKLYVNGVLEGSNPLVSTNTGGNFDIGRHFNSDVYRVSGNVDDLRIYGKALTADQVKDLYESSTLKVRVNTPLTVTSSKTDETCTIDNNGSISNVAFGGGVSGVRYIRIKQNLTAAQDGWLHPAELKAYELFTNNEVAQGKTATSSGISYGSGSYPASNLVDGSTSSVYHSGVPGESEWIEVDLGASYNLDRIQMWTGNCCFTTRYQNMQLILKNNNGAIIYSKQISMNDGSNAPASYTFNIMDASWSDGAPTLNRTNLNAGTYTLSYSDDISCSGTHPVTIATTNTTPTPSFASVSPTSNVCMGTNVTYTTQGGMSNYTWTFPGTAGTDYTLISGGTSSSSTAVVSWSNASSGTQVQVNYENNGCPGALPANATAVTLPVKGTVLSGNESATCYVNGGNNPVHFYSPSGAHGYIGAINPQGENLGLVTLTSYAGSPRMMPDCNEPANTTFFTAYMGRSWDMLSSLFPSSNPFGGDVMVTLPFNTTELNALNTDQATLTPDNPNDGGVTLSNIMLTKISGGTADGIANLSDCGGTIKGITVIQNSGSNAQGIPGTQFVSFNVTEFSEFFLHKNQNNLGSPLPITLTSFSGNCNETGVRLTWTTATETNVSHYEIYRSRNGQSWEQVSTVPAVGDATTENTYEVTDIAAIETMYYQLYSVDNDGTSETFQPVSVTCRTMNKTWSIHPVPVSTKATVTVTTDETSNDMFIITDINGRIISTQRVELEEGTNIFELDLHHLSEGTYFIRINNNDKYTPLKFVKIN